MSSILKVDQIQLSNGNTPTAGDLGLNTTGTALQTKLARRRTILNFSQGNASSYADATDMVVNITPASTSSEFLITLCFRYASNASSDNSCRILRTVGGVSTAVGVHTSNGGLGNIFYAFGNSNSIVYQDTSFQVLDSPNTTSQVTYQVQFANGAGTLKIGTRGDSGNERDNTISVTEIAG